MNKKFLKSMIFCILIVSIVFIFAIEQNIYASNDKPINNKTESKLVQLKETELRTLEDYKTAYGSDSYGLTAYILHRVQIFSIPFSPLICLE